MGTLNFGQGRGQVEYSDNKNAWATPFDYHLSRGSSTELFELFKKAGYTTQSHPVYMQEPSWQTSPKPMLYFTKPEDLQKFAQANPVLAQAIEFEELRHQLRNQSKKSNIYGAVGSDPTFDRDVTTATNLTHKKTYHDLSKDEQERLAAAKKHVDGVLKDATQPDLKKFADNYNRFNSLHSELVTKTKPQEMQANSNENQVDKSALEKKPAPEAPAKANPATMDAPETELKKSADLEFLNNKLSVAGKWEAEMDKDGPEEKYKGSKPVYIVKNTDGKSRLELEAEAEKINKVVGLTSGEKGNGISVTTLPDDSVHLAMSSRRIHERGADVVIEKAAAKGAEEAKQKEFDALIKERGTALVDGNKDRLAVIQDQLDSQDKFRTPARLEVVEEQDKQFKELQELLKTRKEQKLENDKGIDNNISATEEQIRGLKLVNGDKAIINQNQQIYLEQQADAEKAKADKAVAKDASLDKAVEMLKGANRGIVMSDGTTVYRVNGMDVNSEKFRDYITKDPIGKQLGYKVEHLDALHASEIAEKFGNTAKGGNTWIDTTDPKRDRVAENTKNREALKTMIDTDNDGTISKEELKAVIERAAKAGLKVDAKSLEVTLNTGDINSPKATGQASSKTTQIS